MKWIADLFYNFDTLIIYLFAIGNVYVFFKSKILLKSGNSMMYPQSNQRFGISADLTIDKDEVEKLQRKRNKLLKSYSLYANITAIFPLLGIIGTVASLVEVSNETNMMDNLMVALDTTLLGVFFAIIFKALDSFLSGPIEAFVDDADYAIRKFDQQGEEKHEA